MADADLLKNKHKLPVTTTSDSTARKQEDVTLLGVDSSNINNKIWKDFIPQTLASCAALALCIQFGCHYGYSAILLPQLMQDDSDIPITTNEASWIASLVTIFTPIGSVMSGPIMDRIGRKATCMITCIPMAISWAIISFATNIPLLYTGRILAGLAGGFVQVAFVYTSEISHPSIRAALLSLNFFFGSIGISLTYVLSMWFSWRLIGYIYLALACINILVLWPMPETQYWLVTFGRKSGEKTIKWLYRRDSIFRHELKLFNDSQGNNQTILNSNWISNLLSLISDKTCRRPLVLFAIIMFFQQFSGSYVIVFYAIDILRRVGGNFGAGIDDRNGVAIIGAIRLAISVVAIFFCLKFGRRPLMIASSLGLSISMLIASIYLFIYPPSEGISPVQWLPLFCIILFICAGGIGFMLIPLCLRGELLPIKARGTGGSLVSCFTYILAFATVKCYPFAANEMGIEGVFLFFSVISLLAAVYIYIYLPETFQKTFSEIEKYFSQ